MSRWQSLIWYIAFPSFAFLTGPALASAATTSQTITIRSAEMTPLFLMGKSAGPCVEIKIGNTSGPCEASVSVLPENGSPESIPARLKKGDNIVLIPVPAVQAPTSATVTVSSPPEESQLPVMLLPERHWKIFVVPSIHTDIGYTDRQADVLKRHNDNLDIVLEMCRKNPLFKWNIEVAWELENYFAARPPEKRQELINLIKEGRVGLHALYLNLLTGLLSDEGMNRVAGYAASLQRTYGFDISSAVLTDVPSAAWGLPSALAGSGVKYFVEGCNQDRGPILTNSKIRTPFWWEGPDGSRVLTWLSNGYAQSSWLAHAKDLPDLQRTIVALAKRHDQPDYAPDAVYVYGAFLDNHAIERKYANLLGKWNDKFAYPGLQVTTAPDFFQYLSDHFGDKLPVKRCDFGAFWEDGAASSAAETILHMGNQHRAAASEAIWSMAQVAATSASYPRDRMAKVWEDILFYAEHTWGAARSISEPDSEMTRSQWAVKSAYAHRPDEETRKLQNEGVDAYIDAIGAGKDKVVVINPCGWNRGGLVELPHRFLGTYLSDGRPPIGTVLSSAGEAYAYVDDVPAFGSRVLSDARISGKPAVLRASYKEEPYVVQTDPDRGIVAIIDRETGRNLVEDAGPYGFGQVVYVCGGEETRLAHNTKTIDPKFVQDDSGEDPLNPSTHTVVITRAKIREVLPASRGDLYTDYVTRSSAPSMPEIETRLRVHRFEKRISVDVKVTSKTEIHRKEAVYIAFPFAVKTPAFRLGTANAIADPAKDFAHGGCHEWYAVQDFVSCRDQSGGPEVLWTGLDAPLVCLSDINRGRWNADPILTTGTVFSYVMNNYWHTNYKAGQGGDFLFRYELTSAAKPFSNMQCVQFGQAAAQPMIAVMGRNKAGAQGSAGFKYFDIAGEGIVATALKPADDENGIMLRLRNCQNRSSRATVLLPNSAAAAMELDNLVENKVENLPMLDGKLEVVLKPQQVATIRLR